MQHSYALLAARLKRAIHAAQYRVGERLPSVRELATAHDVSVATAVRCYRQLEREGYAEARYKSGTYVADWKALRQARGRLPAMASERSAGMEYERLASLQHRMTQLYALTAQPLPLALHLASAAPDWYPCDALARIAQRQLRQQPLALGAYPSGTGLPAFKTELLAHLAGCGIDAAPDELLITNGATEAMQIALRAAARPGDTIIVESPVYFGLLQTLEHLGMRALEVPCVPGQGLSLEALEYALEHQADVRAVVVMPTFQNPLGDCMPDAAKQRLLKIAQRHDLTVIEDDAFGDLGHRTERPPALKAWDRDGRVIYCGSCSKSMAPAFRLGWVLGGKRQRQLESLKISNSLAAPLLEQQVLADYMKAGKLPAHLRKLRTRLASIVPLARDKVRQNFPAGTRIGGPEGGWWLWLQLPEPTDTLALLRTAVAQGISYTPGTLFSASGKYGDCLRLNIARPWTPELAAGLRALGEAASRAPAA
ncbi:PLP-dependent aminotransferase family protein [Achromobacter deleyi]|uniref:PLP-dependent aminotransferase family protein n=1 Tax=Achromobacter deleyi TaxID=1353891 RepID=A0A7T4B850_9BURK|nr:PLP-dependent aminotransferase family protein [Achromobacter deleyi]QQB37420.1 PLP-dependent aminotransferase family protein [Achromobacter deleyi]